MDPLFLARSELPTRDLDFSADFWPEVQKKRGADVHFQAIWRHVSNEEDQVSPRGASDWWRVSVHQSISVHQDKIRGSAEQKATTAVLRKIPHSNCCKTISSRPLRGRRGRFGNILQQLDCGPFWRTAVQCILVITSTLIHINLPD